MNKLKKVISTSLIAGLLGVIAVSAHAAVEDKYWHAMKKDYFPNKVLEESSAIKIVAPKRAESGAQVPFAFSIDGPMDGQSYIKAVSVIADANPVPLVAVFRFNPSSGKAEISTRIRLEVDSLVHVVAEMSDGKFLVNQVSIRAVGGCGGTIGGDENIARQAAGRMKLSVDAENSDQLLKRAHLLIKHPMNTGLQRDLESQGYRPAFYINRIVAKFNDLVVFDADTYIGVSEDPNIQFPFMAAHSGKLTVVIRDNEDGEFTTSTDVIVN